MTQDGSRSAQFEHTILVTEDGYELVTARVGQPKMVWDEEYTQRPGRSDAAAAAAAGAGAGAGAAAAAGAKK